MRSPHSGGRRDLLAGSCRSGAGRRTRRRLELGAWALPTHVALSARVTLAARCLEEPRRRESRDRRAGEHGPRVPAAEVLDVIENAVRVGVTQIAARALDAVGRLVDDPGRSILALVPQLLAHGSDVLGGAADPLAGLRRTLVDLLANPILGLACEAARLLLRLLRRLAHLLTGLLSCLLGLARLLVLSLRFLHHVS